MIYLLNAPYFPCLPLPSFASERKPEDDILRPRALPTLQQSQSFLRFLQINPTFSADGKQVAATEQVFRDDYHYEVKKAVLNGTQTPGPQSQLEGHLTSFVSEFSGPNTLKIIYYTGHGMVRQEKSIFYLVR